MITDLPALAARARAALADAQSVTLLIQGVGRVPAGSPAVLLHDDEGRPTFLCEPGSPVGPAGRCERPAMLSVPMNDLAQRLTVLVCGRLACVGVQEVDGVPVEVVGLRPEQVLVECDDPTQPGVAQLQVPLELYLDAAPDPLVCCATRIARHTTEDHQPELRAAVARRTGTPFGAIAGVSLAALDPSAALLHWVDLDGAHTVELRFAAAARTPAELTHRLRQALSA